MAEILADKNGNVSFGKTFVSVDKFREVVFTLTIRDIMEVWDRMAKQSNPIINVKNYILTCLYMQGCDNLVPIHRKPNDEYKIKSTYDLDNWFALAVKAGVK